MFDVVIIGAGPAGSTLARYLDKKHKILLVDKRNMSDTEGFKNSVSCGGLLAPDAQEILAHIGISIPKSVLSQPQMFSVNTIDFDNNLDMYYQRNYLNIDREKFDRYMYSFVPENVTRMNSTYYKDYTYLNNHIQVRLSKDNIDLMVKTKLLISAEGSISKVRKKLYGDYSNQYVSIQKLYKVEDVFPHYISVFDKEVTDFYSWIIQKEDKILLGSAIKDKTNAVPRFELLEEKLLDKGFPLENELMRENTMIVRPRLMNDIKLGYDNVFLIGEAAGFISPSSAEGISYAVKSALNLADSINYDIESARKAYKLKSIKLKFNIGLKIFKSKIMYNKTLRYLIMKSKVLSMSVRK